MIRQGEDYVKNQLLRFKNAKDALVLDDENYANHEEKRTQLLKYYEERINSYESQLNKINTQKAVNITVNEPEVIEARSY